MPKLTLVEVKELRAMLQNAMDRNLEEIESLRLEIQKSEQVTQDMQTELASLPEETKSELRMYVEIQLCKIQQQKSELTQIEEWLTAQMVALIPK